MVLFLAVALAADPPPPVEEPTPVEIAEEAPEPMRFGERTFGLSTEPTWTVYRGRHYLTAPQFAEAVGDGPMTSLLALEKRRQTRSAVIFVIGGSAAMNAGVYMAIFGSAIVAADPTLGGVMIASGTTLMLGGVVCYYGTLAALFVRAPRRNRIDQYYSREDAEFWVQTYNDGLRTVEVQPVVGPGYLGVEGRF